MSKRRRSYEDGDLALLSGLAAPAAAGFAALWAARQAVYGLTDRILDDYAMGHGRTGGYTMRPRVGLHVPRYSFAARYPYGQNVLLRRRRRRRAHGWVPLAMRGPRYRQKYRKYRKLR